jgi:hypothetical protein
MHQFCDAHTCSADRQMFPHGMVRALVGIHRSVGLLRLAEPSRSPTLVPTLTCSRWRLSASAVIGRFAGGEVARVSVSHLGAYHCGHRDSVLVYLLHREVPKTQRLPLHQVSWFTSSRRTSRPMRATHSHAYPPVEGRCGLTRTLLRRGRRDKPRAGGMQRLRQPKAKGMLAMLMPWRGKKKKVY